MAKKRTQNKRKTRANQFRIGRGMIEVSENEMPLAPSIETVMIALERAIDSLIVRINQQTQRIKDML